MLIHALTFTNQNLLVNNISFTTLKAPITVRINLMKSVQENYGSSMKNIKYSMSKSRY